MKRFVTISFSDKRIARQIVVLVFLIITAVLFACSSVHPQDEQISSDTLIPDKSFSFKEDGSLWKVDFNNDEISALYKDGVRIPDKEIDDHKEMIYKNLNELADKNDYLAGNIPKFFFDSDKLKKNIEKFKKDIEEDKLFHFNPDFDRKKFNEDMKKFKEQMKKFNDKKLNPDLDLKEFKEKMKELEKYFKNKPFFQFPPEPDTEIYLEIKNFPDNEENINKEFNDL